MIFIMLCTCLTCFASSENTHKRVLFISSYAYDWDSIPMQLEGITSVLGGKAKIDYIFMNTKRLSNDDAYAYTYDLAEKYIIEEGQYDAVLLGDDAALDFAYEYRQMLFNGVPMVFCGINSLEKAESAVNDPLMTGVVEKFPIKETISLALQLYPDAKNVVAISDSTSSGEGSTKQFEQYENQFPELAFSVIDTSVFTRKRLTEKISTYGSDTILLYLISSSDLDGNTYSMQESVERLCAAANIPIFKSDECGIGYGLIGGAVISYREMAGAAAQMALDILNGVNPSSIGVREMPVYYLFDENVLGRFGISTAALPEDSVLINHKSNFFEQNPALISGIGVACIIAGIIIASLTASNINKRRFANQLRASRDSLAAAIDNSSMTYCEYDLETNRLYLGEKAQRVHDLPPVIENIPQGFIDTHCIQPQYYSTYIKLIDEIRSGQDEAEAEIPFYTKKTGGFVWMRLLFALIKSEDGTVINVISTATDITEEKQAQRRYEQTAACRDLIDHETYSSAHLNFTKNLVLDVSSGESGSYFSYSKDTVDGFFDDCLKNIENFAENERLRTLFSRAELVSKFADGLTQCSAIYRDLTESGEHVWLRAAVKMLKNPITADIEAYLYVLDVTDETTQRRVLEKSLIKNLDVAAYLNLKTNIIKQLYTRLEDSIIPAQGMDYDTVSEVSILKRVVPEDAQRCRNYLRRSAILQCLALSDTFSFTVRYALPDSSMHKRFEISYLDKTREIVVFQVTSVDAVADDPFPSLHAGAAASH